MSENTNVLRIQKQYLLGLATWLSNIPLAGKDSRDRSRFVQLVSDELVKLEAERIALLERHAEKDENGDPKKTVDNGVERYVIPEAENEAMNKEYAEMMEEEFILDPLESNKSKIKTVRDILLNTDYKFGPREGDSFEEAQARIRQANDYEKWCEAFESLDL